MLDQRLKKIAGIALTEGEYNVLHFSTPNADQYGMMVTLLDNEVNNLDALAKMLKVPDEWQLTPLGTNLFAAYQSRDRLTLYTDKRDYVPANQHKTY